MEPVDRLTPRERQVLALMAAGHTNADISRELSISFPTAKAHVSSILSKLDAGSREEAVARWRAGRGVERRALVAPLALLAVIGAGVAAAVFVFASVIRTNEGRDSTFRIDLDDLVMGEPAHFVVPSLGESPFGSALGIWVTRRDAGDVTVFFDRDPHSGCAVRWEPDFRGGDYTMGSDYIQPFTGAYRDPCGGWVYLKDDARVVFGASPRSLDAFEWEVEGEALVVHLDRVVLGTCRTDITIDPCSAAGKPTVLAEPPLPAVPDWGRH